MAGHIEMAWRECSKMISEDTPPEQLSIAKSLFFSGALASYDYIANAATGSGQIGATMVMLSIHGELSEFMREMQAIRDGRHPQRY